MAPGDPWIPLTDDSEARSFMNYPSRVAGGEAAFFGNFRFRFLDEELVFMRHAPRRFVQMGNEDWFSNHGFEAPGAETDAAGDDPAAFMQEVMREGLLPAVRSDAWVFRSFIPAFNLLDPPDAMLTDADVFTKVLTAYQDREHRPPQPSLGPPRVDMLAILMQDPIAGR